MSSSSSSYSCPQSFSPGKYASSMSTSESPIDICKCELRVPIRICTTEDNAGRRFHDCFFFPKNCGHFVWVDPEMTRRGVEYAFQLQRENRALQNCVRQLEKDLQARVEGESSYAYVNEERMYVGRDGAVLGGDAYGRRSNAAMGGPVLGGDPYIRLLRIVTILLLILIVILCLNVIGNQIRF